MNLSKSLTPRNTEEVKPGLFIQTIAGRKGKLSYRQVSPAAWDGKVIWKNFLFGRNFLKATLFFLLLLFLVWSYQYDVEAYKNFYEKTMNNPEAFCYNVSMQLNNIEVNYENTIPIQIDVGKD